MMSRPGRDETYRHGKARARRFRRYLLDICTALFISSMHLKTKRNLFEKCGEKYKHLSKEFISRPSATQLAKPPLVHTSALLLMHPLSRCPSRADSHQPHETNAIKTHRYEQPRHPPLILPPRLTILLPTPLNISRRSMHDHGAEKHGIEPWKGRVEAGY